MIAEVIFNLPLERAFHYLVPEPWQHHVLPGMRVLVPFGPRRLVGFVSRLRTTSPIKHPKALLRLIDSKPVLTQEGWQLAQWLATYYFCSLGEACACLIPSALRLGEPLDVEPIPLEQGAGARLILTPAQQEAFRRIESAITTHRHETFLLHGVTGSGKTELYLRAIDLVVRQGRSAICLVPEIALTPQAIDRFHQRFGSTVALWHSRLTHRQRAHTWKRLAEGHSPIVVGTRSAVFAPVKRLGIIILDEEHDASYKQDETPRYHAREVAIRRARMSQAVVLLGDATPSVESYHQARCGRYRLLKLPHRVEGRRLPDVEIIDMRQELSRSHRSLPISGRLQRALRQVVELKDQAILLLNRRGFARVILCPICGAVVRCVQCSVPLVYHASTQHLTCHYCSFQQAPPELCPACQRGYLRFRGAGTERIESELHRLFPMSSIARMDTDATKSRESHRHLYDSMKAQQITVLVGTQMVAKGLDLPQVTLVGVVSADTALNLPDFRAGERTFDLLTQVAGRAGRGDHPGRVLIQTFCPSHYAIRSASRHDYHEFYRAEIQMRRRLKLPPFVHLVELTISGVRRERVEQRATSLKTALQSRLRHRRITLLGPASHRVATIRRTFRWRLILKARSVSSILELLRSTLGEGRRFRGIPVIVDVDPL